MKKYLFVVFCIPFALLAQQDCEGYYSLAEGKKFTYTSYDEKDKSMGYFTQQVADVKEVANGVEATVNMSSYDNKDALLNEGSFVLRCENNNFYIDMQQLMINGGATQAMEGMEVEVQADFLEFPSKPYAGQVLPDGAITMAMKMNGTTAMNWTIQVTDRKVEGFETLTTPAGTFNCVKYTERVETRMVFKIVSITTTWLAEDIGMVKSISVNEKGKSQGYTLLTSYSD